MKAIIVKNLRIVFVAMFGFVELRESLKGRSRDIKIEHLITYI
jgi:hypothetical protein